MKSRIVLIFVAITTLILVACPVPVVTITPTPTLPPAPLGTVTFSGKAQFGLSVGTLDTYDVKLAVFHLHSTDPRVQITPAGQVINLGKNAGVDTDFNMTINFQTLGFTPVQNVDTLNLEMWEDNNGNGIVDTGEIVSSPTKGLPTDTLFGSGTTAILYYYSPTNSATDARWIIGWSFSNFLVNALNPGIRIVNSFNF